MTADPSVVRRATRRNVLAGLGLAALAGTASIATPRRPLAFGQQVPLSKIALPSIGPWRQTAGAGDVVDERVEETERADRTLLFTYASASRPDVMLALSYHSPASRDIKVHRPEICYRSAGFQLSGGHDVSLVLSPNCTIPARRFTGRRGSRREDVLYWTRVARAFPTTALQQRLATIACGLQGRSVDGLLVRISALADHPGSADGALDAFAQALFAAVGPPARALMIGDALRA